MKITRKNVHNYIDTINGNRVTTLVAYDRDLTEVYIPDNIEYIYIHSNKLDGELVLSKSVKEIYCWNNRLQSIRFEDGATPKVIDCADNLIAEIEIPSTIKELYCENNRISELEIPDALEILWCQYNDLTEIEMPDDSFELCGTGNLWDLDFVKWHNLKFSHKQDMIINEREIYR